jgi:hypothetical protein
MADFVWLLGLDHPPPALNLSLTGTAAPAGDLPPGRASAAAPFLLPAAPVRGTAAAGDLHLALAGAAVGVAGQGTPLFLAGVPHPAGDGVPLWLRSDAGGAGPDPVFWSDPDAWDDEHAIWAGVHGEPGTRPISFALKAEAFVPAGTGVALTIAAGRPETLPLVLAGAAPAGGAAPLAVGGATPGGSPVTIALPSAAAEHSKILAVTRGY